MPRKLLRSSVMVFTILSLLLMNIPHRATSAATVTTIRIFVGLGTGTDPNEVKDANTLIKKWNDANPDIQVKFDYNDNATARDVLLTQVAGDQVPDIVGPVGIGGLNSTGDLWADLSKYITADKAELKLADFEPATLGLYQLNGKEIAIPLGLYPSFLAVNKDLFTQAKLPLPPTDYNNGKPQYQGKLWDFAALRTLAIQLTQDSNGNYADEKGFDPTKIITYGYEDVDIDFRGFANTFSPGMGGVKDDGKTANFNNDTYVQSMTWLHDAIFKDHFFPDVAAQKLLNNAGTANTFASGKAAMGYSHTWAVEEQKSDKFKWVAAVVPVAPNGNLTARINADTFAMLDKVKNKDAAWKVLKWLTSSEIAPQLCAIYGCLPARISARGDWEKAIKAAFPNLNLNVIYGAVKYLDIPNSEAPLPNYNQAYDAVNQVWVAVNSDPTLDVKAALDKLNVQVQAIFDGKVPQATASATMAATADK